MAPLAPDPESVPPLPSGPPHRAAAALPGDPFPWSPAPSFTEPGSPELPEEAPPEEEPLFPPDLGEGD